MDFKVAQTPAMTILGSRQYQHSCVNVVTPPPPLACAQLSKKISTKVCIGPQVISSNARCSTAQRPDIQGERGKLYSKGEDQDKK